jgi:hypothetical protein
VGEGGINYLSQTQKSLKLELESCLKENKVQNPSIEGRAVFVTKLVR